MLTVHLGHFELLSYPSLASAVSVLNFPLSSAMLPAVAAPSLVQDSPQVEGLT